MAVSYKKLWKLLIDKNMKKKGLKSCQRDQHNNTCETWQG